MLGEKLDEVVLSSPHSPLQTKLDKTDKVSFPLDNKCSLWFGVHMETCVQTFGQSVKLFSWFLLFPL